MTPSDAELSSNLVSNLKQLVGDATVVEGQNVTGDSFYSSQGICIIQMSFKTTEKYIDIIKFSLQGESTQHFTMTMNH